MSVSSPPLPPIVPQNPVARSAEPPADPQVPSNWIYLPGMGKAAIQQFGCEIDEDLLTLRAVSGVALVCIAMVGLYWAVPAVSLFFANRGILKWIALSLPSCIPGVFEYMRADRALNRRAAEEFIASGSRCQNAMERLCSEPSAFGHLVSLLSLQNAGGEQASNSSSTRPEGAPQISNSEPSERVLSKQVEKEGNKGAPSVPPICVPQRLSTRKPEERNLRNATLRDRIFSENGISAVRSLFIDAVSIESILEKNQNRKSILIRCIELGDVDTLDRIAQKSPEGTAFADMFNPNQQEELWQHVQHEKTIQWLHEKKFKIDLCLANGSLVDRYIFREDGISSVRSLLIDGLSMSGILKKGQNGKSVLIRCIELGDIDVLDRIAQKSLEGMDFPEGTAFVDLFDAGEQMELWSYVHHGKTVRWLHEKGLEITLYPAGLKLIDRKIRLVDSKNASESEKALSVCLEALKAGLFYEPSRSTIEEPSSKQHLVFDWASQAIVAREQEDIMALALPATRIRNGFFQAIPFQHLLTGESISLRKGIDEYIKKPIPTKESAEMIASSSIAARFFRSCGWRNQEAVVFHMQKLHDEGGTLLGLAVEHGNIELFSWLLDVNVSPFPGNEKSGFLSAIRSSDPRFLAMIFQKYPNLQFSEERQYDMWLSVGSQEVAKLLQLRGLNPNIAPKGRQKPLTKLINERTPEDYDSLEKIQSLLGVGAHTSMGKERDELLQMAIKKRDFEVFSLLLKGHLNFFPSKGKSSFTEALQADDARFIKAIFAEYPFFLASLDDRWRLEIWTFVGCEETREFLIEKGLNPRDAASILPRLIMDPDPINFRKRRRALVGSDPNPNEPILKNHREKIECLLNAAAELSIVDQDGNSPLGLAITADDLEVFRLLLNRWADIFYGEEKSGFAMAVQSDNSKFIQAIFEARPELSLSLAQQREMWRSVRSPEVAKVLRARGFNPDIIVEPRDLPVLLECMKSEELSLRQIRCLISAGANLSILDHHENSLLSLALSARDINVFRLLINQGADVFHGGEKSGFWMAVHAGQPDFIEAILAKHPNLGFAFALISDDFQRFRFLLDQGIDPFRGGEKSGFLMAVQAGRIDFIQAIFEARPELSLSLAQQREMWRFVRSPEVARFLRIRGFNPDVIVQERDVPLLLEFVKREEYIKFLMNINSLVSAGADLSVLDNEGNSLLGLAIRAGNIGLFRLLINQGADIFYGGEKSGFWMAIEASQPEFIEAIFAKHPHLSLSVAEQQEMWRSARNNSVKRVLAARGFSRRSIPK